MKKILALLLSLCMIFCLVACGNEESANTDTSGNTSTGIEESVGSDSASDIIPSDTDSQTEGITTTDLESTVETDQGTTDEANTSTESDTSTSVNAGDTLTEAEILAIIQDEVTKKVQSSLPDTLTEAEVRTIVQEEIKKSVNVDEIVNKVLTAIEKKNKFVPGEVLTCPQGNNFTMPIGFMADQTATITSFKVTALKVADINDKNDYNTVAYPGAFYGDYYRYIYQMEVSGKTDPSLAGKSLRVFVSFYGNGNASIYGDNDYMTINTDGTFSFKGRIGSNKVEKDVYVDAIRYKY